MAARRPPSSKTAAARSLPPLLTSTIPLFLDGKWVESVTTRLYENRSPWSGETLGEVAAGSDEDATVAVAAAHAAFPAWAGTAPHERQRVLLRCADLVDDSRGQIISALASETGCGRHFAEVQLGFAANLLRQAAHLPYEASGQVLPSDVAGTRALAMRRPVGVVAAIAPWNASLILSGRAIVGPIALGNTVVLKPSEESPYTGGAVWAELFQAAGLPDGVLNVVTHAPGEAATIGDALLKDPRVRRINFTGSTPTGRRLAEKAGSHLKRAVLQLSGQNPLIVLADADLDHAVEAAAYGAFVHQGQICMCARRIYVERPIAEQFITAFAAKASTLPTGDPDDPATVLGPVINQWALSLLERRVAEAVERGARVVAGGVAAPPCYPATVLVDVPPDTEIASTETFGPVVIIEAVDSAEHAVELANNSDYGLTAAILTRDTYRGILLAARLEAGIVHVNDQPVNDEPHMPFGGVKDSGWGRFGVGFAAEDFTELQWVTSRDEARSYPF